MPKFSQKIDRMNLRELPCISYGSASPYSSSEKKNILDIYLCDAKFQWGLYTDVGLIGGMSLAL